MPLRAPGYTKIRNGHYSVPRVSEYQLSGKVCSDMRPASGPQIYQIPLSLPVKRYATSALTANGGKSGRRHIARRSR